MTAEHVFRPSAPRCELSPTRRSASPARVGDVFWLIRLRWLVTAAFLVAAIAGWTAGDSLMAGGIDLPARAFFTVAVILALANGAFCLQAPRKARDEVQAHQAAGRHLLLQVAVDLILLGVTVNLVGSVETLICAVYLFHNALACIFFTTRVSLAVVLAGSASYVGIVLLEFKGWIESHSVFTEAKFRMAMYDEPLVLGAWLASFVGISLTMWYLVSTLAGRVRERDAQLEQANRALMEMAEERERHMLHVTHELKAPFAAIQANTQLLQKGYCGELPPEAHAVVEKIDVRCQKLSSQIKEMLQLANLRSTVAANAERVQVDLAELSQRVVDGLTAAAAARSVTIHTTLEPVQVTGVPDHLHMLLTNILSNAIAYSFEGGEVRYRCGENNGNAEVVISDNGIGIAAEHLPRIFEEYFRTNAAVQHNRLSTGLGLAIARQVAESHGLTIRVASEQGRGTTFTIQFP